MKQILITFLILSSGYYVYAQTQSWFTDFRDAVFGQNISIAEAQVLFNTADRQARETLNGSALYVMLSRNEYLMGRVYQDLEMNNEAVARFENGISLAERSLAEGENAEAFQMIASLVGQLCMIKPTAWVMANGLRVERNARRALQIDSRNAAALYLLAARWAFGPGLFGNPRRGITELEAILNGPAVLQKNDYFNVYSALAFANNRLNRHQGALSWIQRALALYPTNRFALDLQSEIQQSLGR